MAADAFQTGNNADHARKTARENLRRRGIGAAHRALPHVSNGAQRDNSQQALQKHAAVSDRLRLRLFIQLLGRGARRNQRMEAGNCTACNGYKQSREQQAAATEHFGIGIERGGVECGESGNFCKRRVAENSCANNADNCQHNHAVQQKAGQIVAWLQKNPHGSHRSDQNVNAHDNHPRVLVNAAQEREVVAHGNNDGNNGNRAQNHNGTRHVAATRYNAPNNGNGNEKNGNGSCARVSDIRAVGIGERTCHDRGKSGNNQHQRQKREHAEQLFCGLIDISRNNSSQRLTLVAQRGKQCAKVVHGANENAADKNPQQNGDPAKNCSLNRAVDGAGSGNGRKVVADNNVGLRRNVINAVFQGVGRGFNRVVDTPLFGQPSAIADIAYDQDNCGDDQHDQSVHELITSF